MVSLALLRARPRLAAAVALTLLTLAVHARTLANGFVDYDDRTYVLDNEAVRRGLSPGTAAWAFTTTTAANWHPLTWLSPGTGPEAETDHRRRTRLGPGCLDPGTRS